MITMIDDRGTILFCETEGCDSPATSAWSDIGPLKRACDRHNPMANVAMPLPMNFMSRPLCHACGQPVNLGPQQIVYPGTGG